MRPVETKPQSLPVCEIQYFENPGSFTEEILNKDGSIRLKVHNFESVGWVVTRGTLKDFLSKAFGVGRKAQRKAACYAYKLIVDRRCIMDFTHTVDNEVWCDGRGLKIFDLN